MKNINLQSDRPTRLKAHCMNESQTQRSRTHFWNSRNTGKSKLSKSENQMPSDSQECTVSQKKTRECRARCQPSTQQRAGPPIQYKGNTDRFRHLGEWPVCLGLPRTFLASALESHILGNLLSHGQSSAHKTKGPYSKNPLIPGKLGKPGDISNILSWTLSQEVTSSVLNQNVRVKGRLTGTAHITLNGESPTAFPHI